MNTRTAVLLVMLMTMSVAHAYDREDKERWLGSTVFVDETSSNTTFVLLHSVPVIWTQPEGVKNPIMSLRCLSVNMSEHPMVTAQLKAGGYRVQVYTQPINGETNLQLRDRLKAEARGDYSLTLGTDQYYSREFEQIDINTAEYSNDRQLDVSLVLTRFRGWDDQFEKMYNADGSLKGCYLQGEKLHVTLPDHIYRLRWIPEGSTTECASPWVQSTDDLTDLERLVDRAFGSEPHIEVKERLAPNQILLSTSQGPLWTGRWGEAGRILKSREIDPDIRYQQRTNEDGETYDEGLKKPAP